VQNLFLSDIFLISVSIIVIDYKSYLKALVSPSSSLLLLEDTPSLTDYTDLYQRSNYANSISKHIKVTYPKNSFAIGVIGEWGSGKTDFMLRLKACLEVESENIIVEFNPWRVTSPEAILEDFLQTVSSSLKKYNRSLTKKFREYSKKILQPGKDVQYRLFDTLLHEFFPEKTIQQQYESINSSIKSSSKKLIVIIDDLDRLSGKEVMGILRIIRNTANFSNTFFLVGLDEEYIVKVLENTKDFSNEREYLKKIFQLSITLPTYKKDIFQEAIQKILITDDLSEEERWQLKEILPRGRQELGVYGIGLFIEETQETLMEKLTGNIRDLKRFCNSFKILFHILKGEVDLSDLFIIELIKNRNLELYQMIKQRSILEFEMNDFKLNKGEWDKFAENNKERITIEELGNLKRALNVLLEKRESEGSRRFRKVYNFYLYFSYTLFNLVSLTEFNNCIKEDSNHIIQKFDSWIQNGKETELLRIVFQLQDYPDEKFLSKMVIAYLNINTKDRYQWISIIKELIFNRRAQNERQYFGGNTQLHKNFFSELLDHKGLNQLQKGIICHFFLHEMAENELIETPIFDRDEWNNIMLQYFDAYLSDLSTFTSECLTFFYSNIRYIEKDSRLITLYEPACKTFRKRLVASNFLLEGYLKHFIRPKYYPVKDELVFEPFYTQIFGEWDSFRSLLANTTFGDHDSTELKDVIIRYGDKMNFNGQTSFVIDDPNEKRLIESVMRANSII